MSKDNIIEMLNSSEVPLKEVIAIARTEAGKVSVFTEDADAEKMVILLERAKSVLMKQIELRELQDD